MPNTIAQNLARLVAAKTAIANAITTRGGTVNSSDGLEEFPADITSIPNSYTSQDEGKVVSNGALVAQTANVPVTANGTVDTTLISSVDVNVSTGGGASKSDVNFYDYDGTKVNSYSKSEFLALTEMPASPSHEGLTAQGWNWSLSDAKTYVSSYGKIDISQMYTTSDGATRLHIHLEDGRLSPVLGLCPKGTLTIDWGDGSATETMTGSSTSTLVYLPHTYAQAGNYTISIMPSSGGSFEFGSRGNVSAVLCKSSSDNSGERRVYLNALVGIRIGSSVTSIGSSAFYNCYSLTSVVIPSSVTSIGSNAFYNCFSLTSVVIPSSVTSIGSSAFYNCYSLTSVVIPSSVTSISGNAFNSCYSLTSVVIPSSVTSIGSGAFNSCYSLSSVTIPSSVTSIGSNAFYNCFSLTSVVIPSSVTSISGNAFNSCYSLTSVVIPSSVTSIGGNAFNGCYSLSSVTIPSSVTSISSDAFNSCYSLSSVTIPSSVTSIGSSAFNSCYSLTSVVIPSSVTSIGSGAFNGCYSLSSVTIPSSVTSIGSDAFNNCSSLSSVVIPSSVTSISGNAFYKCSGLGFVKFASSTPPPIGASTTFGVLPTDCIIYVPQGTLAAYTSATNYPDPATYTYVEY